MSLEISSINDVQLQTWAKKCDANSDGSIDGDELQIFQQGKENMHMQKSFGEQRKSTTIAGVSFCIDDIEKIEKNEKDAKFDYTVKFKNGVTLEYDKQSEKNKASVDSIEIKNVTTLNNIKNIKDGDGFKIDGTKSDDAFFVENSTIDTIDGLQGQDSAYIGECIGSGKKSIFAEAVLIEKSDNLVAKNDETILHIDKDHPKVEYGFPIGK